MEYIIGGILVIITLIIVGLILRKRVYDTVDRLEGWKMDIMNRDIASQIARIKNLNLAGETQEKFESWKESWEYIITKELPDIEEYLFDAEEAADRYRFSSAKKTLRKTEQILERIEKDIEEMLKQLDELLESEESSRKEVEEIQPILKELRKQIVQNRYQYGKADVRFEVEIEELEEQLAQYRLLVQEGNYIEAHDLVEKVKTDLEVLEEQIADFPAIYKSCKQELPAQLDDIFAGIKEMKADGYRVEHLGFEKEIQGYQRRLLDCVQSLHNGDLSEAKGVITEIEDRMKEMYQLLEKEAIAKNYMEKQIPSYRHLLQELDQDFSETKTEVETLQRSYYFEDRDMEQYLTLEKTISQLSQQLNEMASEMEDDKTPHSDLREKIEKGFEQVKELQDKHEAFKETIRSLRKDELEARETLTKMKDQIQRVHRQLNKSNIPGVPNFIWDLMDTAIETNNKVLQSLEKHPLDITAVQHALEEANKAVEHVTKQSETMLEQAFLTEQVIQYANRYRSQYPLLAAKLEESEQLFRDYEYELALEKAAKAIEEIEPGALKRVEEHQAVVN
ncbi:septation ring formation regulator EzrA [Oceanobacillus halotolerans]|uniref:septation ring formation regulator EzrA n=1 Tax=Oceanobacillus halotolerans TaxID=2663380 RepID=UPI0013D934BA|nr:septation ring formation regulator EzrA [Oceanobacillus halotolerans]